VLERDAYPSGVPCWVDTEQPDPEGAATFYGGLFGWEFEDPTPSDSPARYLLAKLRGRDVAGIAQPAEGASSTPAWNTYISVASART
jgi:uncharacterized protein